MNEREMNTKLDMAVYITNTLFGKHLSGDPSVPDNNWKVQDLMKRNKKELSKMTKYAIACRKGIANSSNLDN